MKNERGLADIPLVVLDVDVDERRDLLQLLDQATRDHPLNPDGIGQFQPVDAEEDEDQTRLSVTGQIVGERADGHSPARIKAAISASSSIATESSGRRTGAGR